MVTFDVSKDSRRFLSFIQNLRRDVRDKNNPTLVEGVDRLTAEADNPETFDIELVYGDYVAALRVRSDNLYVIGFRNSRNRWFEFSHDNRGRHMIDGATWLPYNGSYTNNGIGSLNAQDICLGRWAVEEAIKHLANFSGTGGTETAFHLRTLIVNLIESTRFDTIANRVDPQMSNPGPERDRRLTGEEISLIRSWGTLSRALMSRVNNPEGPNPFQRFLDSGIRDVVGATAALGMVLVGICRSNVGRPRRSAGGKDADALGLTLVNVIGVRVNNIRGNSLYGTITITDTFGTVELFNRDKNKAQSVGPGGWVDITWPTVPIFGADDLVIDIHLDDEVAHGQVAWNPRDASSFDYDHVQVSKQVKGQSGSVEVHFAVLTNAVLAIPHVVMMDGDAEAVPDVYGRITALTGMAYCGGGLEYRLFEKGRSQYVPVRYYSSINLQRNAMPAPLCSALQVSVDLWDADDISPDDHIANGSVAFNPRLAGNDNKDIHGPCGRVTLYITWSI